jgi:hypothetical protein
MTGPQVNVRVQWGPRKDGLDNCAERTIEQFAALQSVGLKIRNWSEVLTRGRLTQDKNVPRDTSSLAELAKILVSNQQRNDMRPPEIMPELGYGAWFTNGQKEIDLRIRCGAYWDEGGNDCSYSVDRVSQDAMSEGVAIELLRQMLLIWDASFGVIYEGDYYGGLGPSKTLVRYAQPPMQYQRGFPPVGKIIGHWRGGRVWAQEGLEGMFASWNLEPPHPLSIMEKVKFVLARN